MADPMIDENGVPWCQDSCPSHDGKRCTETGFRPARICEPAVIALRAALAKAEAQLSFLSMAVSILPCGHTRENLVKGNQTRTDEGDCAICETLKALERAEARAEKAEAEIKRWKRRNLSVELAEACQEIAEERARAEKYLAAMVELIAAVDDVHGVAVKQKAGELGGMTDADLDVLLAKKVRRVRDAEAAIRRIIEESNRAE